MKNLEVSHPFKGIYEHIRKVTPRLLNNCSKIKLTDTFKVKHLQIKFLEANSLPVQAEYNDTAAIYNAGIISKNWKLFSKWVVKQRA